jgi:hypothetical protein
MKKILVSLASVMLVASMQAQTIRTILVTKYWLHPSIQTAYTAGDIVADSSRFSVPIEFPNAVTHAPGSGQILSATLAIDSINVASGTFRLHLFRDSTNSLLPLTNTLDTLADNAAYVIKPTCRNIYIGYIDFTLLAGPAGSTLSYCQNTAPGIYFTVPERSRSLWGILTATAGYTRPYVDGKGFTITLRIRED